MVNEILKKGFTFKSSSYIFYYRGQVNAYGKLNTTVVAKSLDEHSYKLTVLISGIELSDKIENFSEYGSYMICPDGGLSLISTPIDSSLNEEEVNKQPSSCHLKLSEGQITKLIFNIDNPERKLELIK